MILITTIKEVRDLLEGHRQNGKTIGFIPTMGALHGGHMTLVEHSVRENDITVTSIFVNPTQFNESSDLKHYPRTLEHDLKLLEEANCQMVFFPSVDEMYPPGLNTKVDLDYKGIDGSMEGEFRPGHFPGVAEVINRFLDILEPDRIYMGQKDYQQVRVVHLVTEQLGHSTEVRMVPTVRQEDGLAQSSRNLRLTGENRKKANVIFRTLAWAKEQVGQKPIEEVRRVAMENLAIPNFRPEYFEIIDGETLLPIANWSDNEFIVACTACWAGDIRLIDCMILRDPGR